MNDIRGNKGCDRSGLWAVVWMLAIGSSVASAQDGSAVADIEAVRDELQLNLNIVWTCIAAFLVFFMQAGFAMVESGFTRAKNAVNIIMKNLMDFSVGSLAFYLVGFGLMFGATNGLFGTTLFGLNGIEPGTDWNWTFLIFQTVLPPPRRRLFPVRWPNAPNSSAIWRTVSVSRC